MWFVSPKKRRLPGGDDALPGHTVQMPVPKAHAVNGRGMTPNPGGYCGLGGTGVICPPIGVALETITGK